MALLGGRKTAPRPFPHLPPRQLCLLQAALRFGFCLSCFLSKLSNSPTGFPHHAASIAHARREVKCSFCIPAMQKNMAGVLDRQENLCYCLGDVPRCGTGLFDIVHDNRKGWGLSRAVASPCRWSLPLEARRFRQAWGKRKGALRPLPLCLPSVPPIRWKAYLPDRRRRSWRCRYGPARRCGWTRPRRKGACRSGP